MKSKNHKPLEKLVTSIRDSFQSLRFPNKDNPENAVKNIKPYYHNFAYPASDLSAFTYSMGTFVILLKDGRVIKYKPDNALKFRRWLIENNVRDPKEGNV